MPRQRIDKLGSVGLNADVQPYMLPPQAWTNLYNISTRDGEIRNAAGEDKLFDLAIAPLYHSTFMSVVGVQYIVVSNGALVQAYTLDGTMEDITPVDETPAVVPWSEGFVTFTNLNGVLVVNSETDGPFFWAGPGTKLAPLPGWDAQWRCREMAAYRYYLVALNMTEAAGSYPHKIRWSSAAAEGEIPTEWVGAAGNDAGDDLLGETPGVIVGARLVRDALFIVKEDAVYDLRWIGGEFVMQATRLTGANGGSRLQRGFAAVGGALAIFSTSDLVLFDGQQWRSVADQRIRSLLSGISQDEWVFSQVFYSPVSSQLALSFVEAGRDRLSRALILNLEENTWGSRALHNGYGFDFAVVTSASGIPTWDQFGPTTPYPLNPGPMPRWIVTGTWDDQTDGTWNKGVYRPNVADMILYQSNPEDTAWWVSVIGTTPANFDGSAKFCKAERVSLPIGGSDNWVMVDEVWPELRGDVPVQMWIGAQEVANGPVAWDGPYDVDPGSTQSFTPRISGRYIAVRVESQAIGEWAMGAVTLNWRLAGDR